MIQTNRRSTADPTHTHDHATPRAPRQAGRIWAVGIGLLFPYVWREPAPIDLLFVVMTLAMLLGNRIRLPIAVIGGACVYFALSLIPLANTISHYPRRVGLFAIESIVIDLHIFIIAATVFCYLKLDLRNPALLMKWIAIGATVCAVVTAIFLVALRPYADWLYRDASFTRIKGTFKDPNVFGPYLSMGAMCWLVIPMTSQRRRRIRAASLALLIVLLLLTQSRGALLGIWVSVATYLTFWNAERRRRRNGSREPTARRHSRLVLVSVALLATIVGGAFISSKRTAGALARLSSQAYDTSRFELIVEGMNEAIANPLGSGAGVFGFVNGANPHNLFIGKVVDAGLIPALLLAAVLYLALARTYRILKAEFRPEVAVVFSLLVGHTITSMFIYSHHWRHFAVLVALAFALPAPTTPVEHEPPSTPDRARSRHPHRRLAGRARP